MKKKKNNFNILSVKKEDRSSRFVIDLKDNLEKEEAGTKTKNDFHAMSRADSIKRFFEKLAEFNFKKFVERCLPKRGLGQNIEFKDSIIYNSKVIKIKQWYDSYFRKLEQLAFFSLFRFVIVFLVKIFKWLYKFCYIIGWLILFFIRFLGLVFYGFFKLILPVIYKLIFRFRFIIQFLYINLREGIGRINKFVRQLLYLVSKKLGRIILEIRTVSNLLIKNIWAKTFSHKQEREEFQELEKERERKKSFWLRPISFFVLVLLIIILPFKIFTYYKSLDLGELKGEVLGVSEDAVNDLIFGAKSITQLNFSQASNNFSKAGDNFLKAQEQLEDINGIIFSLASLVPKKEIRLASASKQILAAGEAASNLGNSLSLAFETLFNSEDKDILEIINDFSYYGNQVIGEAQDLNWQLNEIDIKALPDEYKGNFLFLKEKTISLEKGMIEFINIVDKLKVFLGAEQDKRYLLVFQNNTELRATGGFIGSFALIDLREGKIKQLEVPGGGSYDTEGALRELVAAPEPLRLVNPLWHFWDANWWPDWPTSARKLMWFYEKSGGSTVDGVISFTPTVLERLLNIVGPIDMSQDYGVIFTAENFWINTQTIAEKKLTAEQIQAGEKHEPKKIIGDLLDVIIKELPNYLNKDNLVKLLSIVETSLSEKHILFYFIDENLQKEVEARDWGGKLRQTNWDYLSVINTNIAGGKSDKRIEETINHKSEIMPNGSIINTVKIIRTHTGIKGEPFSGVRNVNWMRIYVPAGSQLLEAQGFRQPDPIYFEEPDISWQPDPLIYRTETMAKVHGASGTKIYEEEGKTVFANWTMVDPGESITIYLKYKLPFILKDLEEDNSFLAKVKNLLNPTQKKLFPYTLFFQKQAGAMPSEINSNLKLSDNFRIVWKYPKNLPTISEGWQISDELNIDKYWAVLLEKQD